MPLDLSRIELGAMGSAAGHNLGNLRLDVPDWGAYGKQYAAAQLAQQQLAEQYAGLQNNLQQQQLQNQGAMARQQIVGQQGLNLADFNHQFDASQNELKEGGLNDRAMLQAMQKQQELAQQAKYQQGQLGVSQQNADTYQQRLGNESDYKQALLAQNQQRMEQEQHLNDIKARAELGKEANNKLSAFGATAAIIAKNYANDPTKYQQAIADLANHGLQDKIIDQSTAQQMLTATPDQVQMVGMYHALMGEHANTYADAIGVTGKNAQPSGSTTVTLPDGTVVQSVRAQKNAQSDAQKQVEGLNQALQQVKTIGDSYNKDYLTMMGKGHSAIGSALSSANLGPTAEGVIKTASLGYIDPEKDKELAAKRQGFITSLNNLRLQVMQTDGFKRLTPALQKLLEDSMPTEHTDPDAFPEKARAFQNYVSDMIKVATPIANGKFTAPTQKDITTLNDSTIKMIQSKNVPGIEFTGTSSDGKPKTQYIKNEDIGKWANYYNMTVPQFLTAAGVLQNAQ